LVRCHAGCDIDAILSALGLRDRDLFAASRGGQRRTFADDANRRRRERERLLADARVVRRLWIDEGWTRNVLARYGVGLRGDWLVLPERDSRGHVCGELRVAIHADEWDHRAKRAQGSRGLFFPLEGVPSDGVWLFEGPTDALSAASLGFPAVSYPSATWRLQKGSQLFADVNVVVVPDCDEPGRDAGLRLGRALAATARSVRVIELDPFRDGGDDLRSMLEEFGEDEMCRALGDLSEQFDPLPRPGRGQPAFAAAAAERFLRSVLRDGEWHAKSSIDAQAERSIGFGPRTLKGVQARLVNDGVIDKNFSGRIWSLRIRR
jgi:hypothetical protein